VLLEARRGRKVENGGLCPKEKERRRKKREQT
jgi:hypothetical protein